MSGMPINPRWCFPAGRVIACVVFSLALITQIGEAKADYGYRPFGAPPVAPAGPANRLDATGEYEYAFDPYTWRVTASRRGLEEGYIPPNYNSWLYLSSAEMARGLSGTPRIEVGALPSDESIYGYVDVEADEPVSPSGDGPWTYYYDSAGRLRYGRQALPQPPVERRARPPQFQPAPSAAPTEPPRVERFEGRVIETAMVTSRTDNRVHMIVRLEQPDGLYRSVQMGPIGPISLQKGDWVEGFGTPGVLRGRPVLLAMRVGINGTWRTIQTHVAPEVRDYAGEIMSLEAVRMRDIQEPQGIAEVRMDSGSTEIVLLGPADELQRGNLMVGDRIILWARPGTMNGMPALVGEQIEVDDRKLQIEYSPARTAFEAW